MDVTERWAPGSPECHKAAKLLYMRKYQRALNVLVVAHVFELSKMNCSQSGKSSLTWSPFKC
jgi:hypothetical protein